MKRLVYHDCDPDGWMCAAILLKTYPDIELIEVGRSENDIIIKSDYDEVYVVDQSLYSEERLKEVQQKNKRLIWIDHHQSSIDAYSKDYDGVRDTNYSACILVWNYLYPKIEVPLATFHVGDMDLWKFENKNTNIFFNYLRTIPQEEIIPLYRTLIEKDDLSKEY